ncbi:PAS domain-containing protein [Nannocystis punicea]|uniref:PAS domain-containing protein n=1 Tax=Nannocystis punicea TaxID=2995304 RepID=A0ABY7H939_9BACT|nr:PAS domain-containing protein [Nannocystis poenicansa]WAS95788.1 PAS domain-containing protein [Nannocystis poenicansa]
MSTAVGSDNALQEEVLALRQRVAALEQELAPLRRTQELLQRVMDNLPQAIFWKDRESVFLGCNEQFARHNGVPSPAEIIGKTDRDMPWAEFADLYRADDRRVMETDAPKLNYEEPVPLPDGTEGWLRTSKIPLHDDIDAVFAVLGMYEDITAVKRAEAERLRAKEQEIQAQADILAELSTPLIPITDVVMVMPMIGKIDARRAQQILETLLSGIAANRARTVILDITRFGSIQQRTRELELGASRCQRGASLLLLDEVEDGSRTAARVGATDLLEVDLRGRHVLVPQESLRVRNTRLGVVRHAARGAETQEVPALL